MPKISAKRQITLPAAQCRALGLEPGDEVESFIAEGSITIVGKKKGAARGLLKHVRGDPSIGDEASLQSALTE